MVFFKEDDVRIFPSACNTVFYTDEVDNGNSEIIKQAVDSTALRFQYQLQNQYVFPYCGVGLEPKNTKEWDLSKFNRVEISIKSEKLSSIHLFLHVYEPNVKNKTHRLALRHLSHNLKLVPGEKRTLVLDLHEFETATWWYSMVQQDKSDFGEPDLSKVRSIHFMSGLDKELNTTVGYEITDIRLTNNYTLLYLQLSGIWCVFLGISWLFLKRSMAVPEYQIEQKPKVEIAYKPIVLPVQTKETYLEYIHANFQNPDISLRKVSEETGVSERIISSYISENYSCNFKSYINNIRVNEAKRLLQQGAHNSGEVAYLVGFNSPASFNRVFKSIVGTNPTAYLQNSQKP